MRPLLLDIYRLTGFFLYPLVRLAAPIIRLLPGRIAYNFSQRLGVYGKGGRADLFEHTDKPSIWLHAASMGEMQAALILLNGLCKKYVGYRYILSSTTKQGCQLAQSRLPKEIDCIVAPLDMPQAVNRAIQAIRPSMYICLETELWPQLLTTLQTHRVPMLLLNGRMSARSLQSYKKIRTTIAAVLQGFSAMALISQRDLERFVELGVAPERMTVTGNIKFDLPCAADSAHAIRAAHRTRLGLDGQEKVLICGSTHGGEEELLLSAFLQLGREMPLILVLAPRHQERFAAVEALLRTQGCSFERYSQLRGGRSGQVVLVDTMGDLADLYSAADFIFCGGSLLPRLSGHNVMEAARWGRPVYFGPHMKDWQDAADLLVQAGGGFEVEDMTALTSLVREHAASPPAYERACLAARETAASQRGALARQIEMVHGFL
ncbi:MAG: hypothetical protein GX087_11985 [Desulfobulbaceae bacterium]|nr:hypothetical protein [Desulfobulbaceae bacterium]